MVSGLDGICILLGSILGHGMGKVGLFSGAIIGGILGVALAVWLATRLGLLKRKRCGMTFLGGIVGFVIAALIAVNNLHGPLIPVLSVSLIGTGALLGKMLGHQGAA